MVLLMSVVSVQANVFDMPSGFTSLETVTVGNPGNAGELSGAGAGGFGPDRICGAVSYTYNIGKYEVTAGQYCGFLNAVAKTDTYGLYNGNMSGTDYGSGITRSGGGTVGDPYTYSVASSHVNRPVTWVSYWDSCRFANWLHNGQPTGAQDPGTTETGAYTLDGYNGTDGKTIQRNPDAKWAMPTEDEWYKAAYYDPNKPDGGGYWDYPTGSDMLPGRDMADVPGNNANYYGDPYPIDPNQGWPPSWFTTVIGEFQNSDSPYGTFDQGGNVYERNEAVVYEGDTFSGRGLRGGSFFTEAYHMLASGRNGSSDDPTYEGGFIGFRVVQVPEPATLSLLVLGGFLMLRRRSSVL